MYGGSRDWGEVIQKMKECECEDECECEGEEEVLNEFIEGKGTRPFI